MVLITLATLLIGLLGVLVGWAITFSSSDARNLKPVGHANYAGYTEAA